MKRTTRHTRAIEIIHNQIDSLKHEQEGMFIAGEPDIVNNIQDIINQLTSSVIALNELSITKPLRNIKKLRDIIGFRKIKQERSVTFDTIWHNYQVCAIVPTRILEKTNLEL